MCDKRPMELADTAEMMMSKDYKERFRAEYCQVVIRYQKLKAMLEKWDNGELNFTPTQEPSLWAAPPIKQERRGIDAQGCYQRELLRKNQNFAGS